MTWTHAKHDLTHPCEPRYGADGKWVCFKCREPVNLDGQRVDMRGLPTPILVGNPDTLGLQNEGS